MTGVGQQIVLSYQGSRIEGRNFPPPQEGKGDEGKRKEGAALSELVHPCQ